MYGLSKKGEAGESLEPWEIPWLKRHRRPPSAESGLSADEGVSLYGPCSEKKVLAEHRRLMTIASSIRKYGYRPETFGYIEGHFLLRGNRYRFFVRGGKHRAAVLTYYGNDTITVRVRPTWPRVIADETINEWPLVRSGEISPVLADKILERYFDTA
jgi:hypothetical protein